METPSGLINVWAQGDWVARGVLLLLLAMSVASWLVIVSKLTDLLRLRRIARAVEPFWACADLAQGLRLLGEGDESPFRSLAEAGQAAVDHHARTKGQLADGLDASEWITRGLRNAVDASSTRLQSGLAILASVGSTAPFIGLFGTVWGIYHALMGIAAAGQATIDRVAGPVGEALIMTALGLAVAIPAVLGYNALVRGNRAIVAQLQRFAHDLHAYFITGARTAQTPSGASGDRGR